MAIVLILGEDGEDGKCEEVAVRLLGDTKYTVRCGLRNPRSEVAEELSTLGAECVKFTFDDASTWEDALAGVESLFVVLPPFNFEKLPILTSFVEEAKNAGIVYVVNLCLSSACYNVAAKVPIEGTILAKAGFAHYSAVLSNPSVDGYGQCSLKPKTSCDDAGKGGNVEDVAEACCNIRYIQNASVSSVCAELLRNPGMYSGTSFFVREGGHRQHVADVRKLLARCCPSATAAAPDSSNATSSA